VHTVTYWWATDDIYYYTNYVENLENVTREDIKRYVETYIIDRPHASGILLTSEMRDKMVLDAVGF
jgi:zinc protease